LVSPCICALAFLAAFASAQGAPNSEAYEVGLAKIDITPEGPIRLSGFYARQTESVGVRQKIYARAMALRTPGGQPAVLIGVDSIGIPLAVRNEVADRLQKKRKLPNERFVICATHSHTTPMIAGVLPTMFGAPVPPDQQKRIDKYTSDLTDKLENVATEALDQKQPCRLTFGIGNVGFSINRRTKGGPVDHSLPVIAIRSPQGKLLGLFVSYACHCVVLSDFKVSGDWAGYAAEELETLHPDSIAIVTIGCGADSNPASGVTGDKFEIAAKYGKEIAGEVGRLLGTQLARFNGNIVCELKPLTLELQKLPARDQWMERTKAGAAEGYYAKYQLSQIDSGKKLPTEITYPIQTWRIGNSLAAVFLPGEVVVDYALRLKTELDATRLIVNAYSNDCPAYIPSERVLKEGGYEGGGAMIYYSLPAPFAPGLENKIISAVHAQLGDEFKAHDKKLGTQGTRPRAPAESLATIKVGDDLKVELVASEPLIRSPTSIDFGPDGKVWVSEAIDYGCKDGETCPPTGRVSFLEDRDADGAFESATVFLDKISEPFGVTVWRKGVLISAAPDLIYAEDTNGDGRADVVQKLFTGFSVENPQARLNTLAYDLDGWFQAGSSFNGKIKSAKDAEFDVPNRDFRLQADEQVIDPESGKTENGRVRDDWGNWFGTDNSSVCWHFPFSDRYLRRNPHIIPPSLMVYAATPAASQLFPRGKIVLLPLSGPAGNATAACGMGFYRDELLGAEFAGNAFTCEPVHQLVHRMIVRPNGTTFTADRAPEETKTEFLTSTDNWFRPVQAKTGPDGALWIVDMYRYVIEHSRWIPQNVQDELDVYAGNNMGRIYRVLPNDAKARPFSRLDKLNTQQLVAALDSPNGWQRDMAQQLLVWRADKSAAKPLTQLLNDAKRPQTRLHALCTLALLDELPDNVVSAALSDPHAGVRRQAIRLAEAHLKKSPDLLNDLIALADTSDPIVALQLACTLGATSNPGKLHALAKIAQTHGDDTYVMTGVMSAVKDNELGPLLKKVFAVGGGTPQPNVVKNLMQLAGTAENKGALDTAIDLAATAAEGSGPDRFDAIEALLAGLRRSKSWSEVVSRDSVARLKRLTEECVRTAKDENADIKIRVDCLRILGHTPQPTRENIQTLAEFLSAEHDSQLQIAAVDALAERNQPVVAEHLINAWRGLTPALRAKVLDVLLTRKQWVEPLLAAIESRTLQTSEIDAAHQSRLSEYPDPDLQKKAKNFFAQSSAERAAVFERYRPALGKGNAKRGQAVFEKNCSVCHRFGEIGTEVGPNIAARQDKSNDGLLREILDPNRAVDQKFAEYVAVTTDGVVKNGILAEETGNSITLVGQQGAKNTLLRSQIESLNTSGKSLMPEGLEKQITPEEMADLIRFLAAP
jgi:putative membrane-bound dehydrogenase-like protein